MTVDNTPKHELAELLTLLKQSQQANQQLIQQNESLAFQNKALQESVNKLQHQLEKLQRMIFGQSSERLPSKKKKTKPSH